MSPSASPRHSEADHADGDKQPVLFLAPFAPDATVQVAVTDANRQARDGLSLRAALGFNYALEDDDGPSYVDDALDAVAGLQEYGDHDWTARGGLSAAELEADLGAPFTAVLPVLPVLASWLGQPGEPVQWKTLYVIIYDESMNVAVLDKDIYEL